jgi:hypothetical protein
MHVMTDVEVREFLKTNSWATGIKVDTDGGLFYDSPGANCLVMNFPETPLKVTYVARLISMLGVQEEALFYGALLWVRLWTIGSTQLEKSGWRLIERMRMGFGELRPLEAANGHGFRADELADLAAFIVPCLVYGWDAYVVPANAGCFAFISHDEFWCVVTRDAKAHARALDELSGLKPRTSEAIKAGFCKPNVAF